MSGGLGPCGAEFRGGGAAMLAKGLGEVVGGVEGWVKDLALHACKTG